MRNSLWIDDLRKSNRKIKGIAARHIKAGYEERTGYIANLILPNKDKNKGDTIFKFCFDRYELIHYLYCLHM